MTTRCSHLGGLAALVALTLATPAAQGAPTPVPERPTLSDCLRIASEHHPDLQAAEHAVAAAEDEARAVRSSYLPTLTLEAGVQRWDDAMTVDLGEQLPADGLGLRPPTEGEQPESAFDGYAAEQIGALLGLLGSVGQAEPIELREQTTWSATLRLVQPITPLYSVYQGHQARRAQAEGTRAAADTARADVALAVGTAYYAALQAAEFRTITDTAVQSLTGHLERVRLFHERGLVGRNEVLLLEVELSNALARQLEARLGTQLAEANLATQMGLSDPAAVQPLPLAADAALEQETVPLERAVEAAQQRRSELRQLVLGRTALGHAAKAAWWKLTPQVVLLAQYEHTKGHGAMALEDTFFVGAGLNWEVFGWGKDFYAARAADSKAAELDAKVARTRQLLRLDVTAKHQRMQTAAAAFEVATRTVAQAEEALRLQRERFDAQQATAQDVIDAEGARTRAHASRTNARYAYLLARAQLRRAMGETLD